LILRGQEQISPKPLASSPNPRSSLVIIGRQQNGVAQAPMTSGASQSQPLAQREGTYAGQRSSVYLSENNAASRAQPARPAWYDSQAPGIASANGQAAPRAEPSRATPWLNPGAAASAPGHYRNAPQPQAPANTVQRSYNTPSQTYRSQPAPNYSSPSRPSYSEVPRSAPAPAYSGGGGRSAPAPSYSGGSGGGAHSAPAAPSAPSGNAGSSGRR
jgi:hypothetical protein